jgi:flagellar P-ring protein precursor FlgI
VRRRLVGFLGRAVLGAVAAVTALGAAHGERIKDLASIQGVRPNPLIGYGLVVGLDGTGDQTTQTPFTTQSIQSLLGNLGINLPPGTNPQLKNVAAVMVTAQLPAFARPGQLLDVTVSSLGNAKSLRGGTLLLTPLKGADGQIYAMAQGNVVVAGAGASAAGSSVQINQLNAGRVPGGATVERPVPTQIANGEAIQLELRTTDFGVAKRVADAINARWGAVATPLDGRVIAVRAPAAPEAQVAFIAELESLAIESPPAAAKVIINARTGSVVMNRTVTLEPCAIAHGNLSIVVATTPLVSQPAPFGAGTTVLTERADIQIQQDGGSLVYTPGGAQLADVVKALNAMGVRPADLLAILQAMKAAGALKAELEVI